MGVSVTIIARNEAANIKDCLESVQWADQVVLVDTFSTDGTPEIARELGAEVYQEPWQGFARQKNSALEKAAGPWILSLDADERVTPALSREIEQVVGGDGTPVGYLLARKNYFGDRWIRHGGWYPDYNLRLFRKGAGRFQERAVHEKVTVTGEVGRLANPLEHYTYASVAEFLRRLERYSRLAAQEISRRPGSLGLSLVFSPVFTFLKMYLFRLGLLDGRPGLFLAVSYAYYTFLKYYRGLTGDFFRDEDLPFSDD